MVVSNQITNLWGLTVVFAFGLENQGPREGNEEEKVADSLELVGILNFKKRTSSFITVDKNSDGYCRGLLP